MVLIWDSGFAPMHCNVSNQLTAHFIHTLCLFGCTRTSFWRKEGFSSPAMPAHRSHAFPSPTPWMAFHCADRGSSWRRRGGGREGGCEAIALYFCYHHLSLHRLRGELCAVPPWGDLGVWMTCISVWWRTSVITEQNCGGGTGVLSAEPCEWHHQSSRKLPRRHKDTAALGTAAEGHSDKTLHW